MREKHHLPKLPQVKKIFPSVKGDTGDPPIDEEFISEHQEYTQLKGLQGYKDSTVTERLNSELMDKI